MAATKKTSSTPSPLAGMVDELGDLEVWAAPLAAKLARLELLKKSVRQHFDGHAGLPVDPMLAQLWIAEGVLPARGIDRGIALGGARQSGVGGRASGLDEADAKVPGPDERAGPSGGVTAGRSDGDEDTAGDREGRKGSAAIGEIAGPGMP